VWLEHEKETCPASTEHITTQAYCGERYFAPRRTLPSTSVILHFTHSLFSATIYTYRHTYRITRNGAPREGVFVKGSCIALRMPEECPDYIARRSPSPCRALCAFRNSCDATGPRRSYVARFAVQITYHWRRRIARIHEKAPRTRASTATGSPFWKRVRRTNLRIWIRRGRAASTVRPRTIRKRHYWTLLINSLLRGKLNLLN